jgi:hypothetical protein
MTSVRLLPSMVSLALPAREINFSPAAITSSSSCLANSSALTSAIVEFTAGTRWLPGSAICCSSGVAPLFILRLAALLDPLVERLQHSCIHRGDHVYRSIQLFFGHPRFPCVRKAPVHSRIAQVHHRYGQAHEHFLTLGQAVDGMGIAIESSEISFLHQ